MRIYLSTTKIKEKNNCIKVYEKYQDMNKDEVTDICKVLNSSFNNNYQPMNIKNMFYSISGTKKLYYICFSLLNPDKIIGFCNISYIENSNTTFLFNLAVDPEYRKCGIATKLLKKVLNICDTSNFKLEVDNDDDLEWKYKFYEKMGFKKNLLSVKLNRYCLKYHPN